MRWLALLWLAGCAHAPNPLDPLDELWRFARRQDGVGLSRVGEALAHGQPDQRRLAAFALGQLGVAWEPVPEPVRAAAERALLDALPLEPDPTARDRVIEALGKVGSETGVPSLLATLAAPVPAERARAAVSLGLLAKNQHIQPAGEEPLQALLDDPSDEVRWGAAYALYRMKRGELRPRLRDRSWKLRALSARALGERALGGEELLPLFADADERVAAEAGRALAKTAVACARDAPCPALEILQKSAPWRPAVAAAVAVEPITHPSAVALFAARAGGDCLLALAHDRALGRLDRLPRCDGDARRRNTLAARALGEAAGDVAARTRALLPLAADAQPAVRAAAAEALGRVASAEADEELVKMIDHERDLAVLAAAGEAAGGRRLEAAGAAIVRRLELPSGPDSVEALQALAGAAASLKLRAARPLLVRLMSNPQPALRTAARGALRELGEPLPPAIAPPVALPPPLPRRRVTLVTTRGSIVVEIYQPRGPRTVANFLKLVKAHFYDGLSFHRVVADFVVQGGDPRGDGSGGPGWSIPCEIGLGRYREGTVGMALSGRDTGGSQLFIALSDQPHLDGRYPALGEVVQGMEVVRALVEGDRIVSARSGPEP